MDILSHGLWAAAGARGANGSSRLRSSNIAVRPYWAFFWGIFPDLFAFTIPFTLLIGNIVFGPMEFGDWPRPERGEPPATNHWPGLQIASTLYQYSHSIIVFAVVIVIVMVIVRLLHRRFPFEMLGWPLHILMDIPTHTYRFFPTPMFWPISQWRFDGILWASPWFIAVNYGSLVVVFLLLRRYGKKDHL